MMDTAEHFNRIAGAIAYACSLMPNLDKQQVERWCDAITQEIDRTATADPKLLPPEDRERLVAFTALLRVAVEFKEAGDRVQALGAAQGPLSGAMFGTATDEELEETITPDHTRRYPAPKR